MDLKELLGDAYKEGMTIDEMNAALASKKLVDLDSGNYVNKDKAKADIDAKEAELKRVREELAGKLTEEEKTKKAQEDKENELKQLQETMAQLKRTTHQTKIEAALSETKIKLEIKDDDKEFQDFVSTITNDDEVKNLSVATYLSKILKNAYEKGSSDAKKEQIAKNKNFNSGSGDGKDAELGARLAKQNKPAEGAKKYDYFAH